MKKSVYVKKPKADEIEQKMLFTMEQKGYEEKMKQIVIQQEIRDNKAWYILKQKLYQSIDMLDFYAPGLEEWIQMGGILDDDDRLLSIDSFPENSAVNFCKIM